MAKILIVDDAEVQRFRLAATLEGAGHQPIEAHDGQDGLVKLEQNPDIALIICDVHMPIMDGITMCTEIHKSTTLPHPPIFMLTTEAGNELKAGAKEMAVVAWIYKPFKAEKLLEGITKILSR